MKFPHGTMNCSQMMKGKSDVGLRGQMQMQNVEPHALPIETADLMKAVFPRFPSVLASEGEFSDSNTMV